MLPEALRADGAPHRRGAKRARNTHQKRQHRAFNKGGEHFEQDGTWHEKANKCGCKDNDDGRGYEGYARMSEQLPLPNTNPQGKAKARVMKGRKTNPPIIISGLSLTIPKARRTAAMKIRPTKLYVMCVNCQSS